MRNCESINRHTENIQTFPTHECGEDSVFIRSSMDYCSGLLAGVMRGSESSSTLFISKFGKVRPTSACPPRRMLVTCPSASQFQGSDASLHKISWHHILMKSVYQCPRSLIVLWTALVVCRPQTFTNYWSNCRLWIQFQESPPQPNCERFSVFLFFARNWTRTCSVFITATRICDSH